MSGHAREPKERTMEAGFELVCCTDVLLHEIGHGATRRAVAQTYRLAMHSSHPTDWARVNAAIIARWSASALKWIKEQAWSGKCFAPKGR